MRSNVCGENIQENRTACKISASLVPLRPSDVRHSQLSPNRIFLTTGCKHLLGIGDIPFKQPPVFTRRILYNLYPGFHNTSPWEDFLVLNHTPPYISAKPEITHRRLDRSSSASARTIGQTVPSRLLILSSDGLTDLCQGPGQQKVIGTWARNLQRNVGERSGVRSGNMALQLLWQALGAEDNDSVSRVLTLDMDSSWIDDTAIVIQVL
jgi:pyruvate dehydrogenase phosphatase